MKWIIAQYTGLAYDHVKACTFYPVEPQAVFDQYGQVHLALALAYTQEQGGQVVEQRGTDYLYALTASWHEGIQMSASETMRVSVVPAKATHWLALSSFHQRGWAKDWRSSHGEEIAEAAAHAARVYESAVSEVFRRPCMTGNGLYLQGLGTASGEMGYVFQVPVNVLAEKVLRERALTLVNRDPLFYWLGPRRGSSANPVQYLYASCWHERPITDYLKTGKAEFPKRLAYRGGGSDTGFTEGRSYEVFPGTTDYYVAYNDKGSRYQVSQSDFEPLK